MKFKPFATSLLAILGLSEWGKVDGKSTITEENVEKLKTLGFSDTFLTAFKQSLENNFKEEEEPKAKKTGDEPDEKSSTLAVLKGVLAETTTKLAAQTAQMEAMKKNTSTSAEALAQKDTKIAELTKKIAALSAISENDPGKGKTTTQKVEGKMNLEDEKQLCGFEGEMFALDRPYNMRAKAAMLYAQGKKVQVDAESSIDYSTLKTDLGAFYRIPWQERLQSFLEKLPSIEKLFPVESGYQDLAVLVNIWLGEFSQADNTSSDFDNVVKGQYEFDDETLRMYSVMFVHKFKNLKDLEKTWIGSLNKEGSQVIKWSFIEYILAETAKKLYNERELRRINGVRKEPDLNKPGRAMEAADGLYEFLNKKVNGHLDLNSGKTVYQIKPFVVGEINESNIGEKIFLATGMIPAVYRDSGKMCLYIPSKMLVWYHKYNELHYGTNQDYKANMMFVKEYPSVEIKTIPNADNHQRLIWTLDGNFKCYEHVPGEMTKFNLEQQDWTLKVWSNWKESIWAKAVGKKFTKKDDMDYDHQLIFCTESDYSPSYFVESQKDANPSVKIHTSVKTVANTSLLAITDIADAEVGQIVTLQCGSVDKGVKIAASDKFSLLASDWEPGKGDIIKLMKRADGKFIDLGRTNVTNNALAFDADDATPSVSADATGATSFVTNANTKATAITDLKDAVEGVIYTIYGAGSDNASTIANSGNFVLTDAMTLSEGKFIQLVKSSDKFYEVKRN